MRVEGKGKTRTGKLEIGAIEDKGRGIGSPFSGVTKQCDQTRIQKGGTRDLDKTIMSGNWEIKSWGMGVKEGWMLEKLLTPMFLQVITRYD